MKPLEYMGIPVAMRDELAAHEPILVWRALLLALYCAHKVNGGVIERAAAWTVREWIFNTGMDVPLAQGLNEPGLWHWKGGNLIVDLYNTEYEAKAVARRTKGSKAIAARWEKKREQTGIENQREEYSSNTQVIPEKYLSNTASNTSKDKSIMTNTHYVRISPNTRNKHGDMIAREGERTQGSAARPKDAEEVIDYIQGMPTSGLRGQQAETEARKFFDYYESQGWTKANGASIYNWKALARSWVQRAQLGTHDSTRGGVNKKTDYEL